jgi:hypothetical protein
MQFTPLEAHGNEELHSSGRTKRLLRVMQYMCHGIHSDLVVRSVDSPSFHCTLVRVTRRLVMIGKGMIEAHTPKSWTDESHCVCGGRYRSSVSKSFIYNHSRFFLFRINVFNETFHEQSQSTIAFSFGLIPCNCMMWCFLIASCWSCTTNRGHEFDRRQCRCALPCRRYREQ